MRPQSRSLSRNRRHQDNVDNSIRLEDNENGREEDPDEVGNAGPSRSHERRNEQTVGSRRNQNVGVLKKIEFDTKISKIFASNGCEHVICVDENGQACSFGFNQRGQLGHGHFTCLSYPKEIENLSKKIV